MPEKVTVETTEAFHRIVRVEVSDDTSQVSEKVNP